MNVLMLLTNKANTTYFFDHDSILDGICMMRESGYSAVPVIDAEGKYVGCVSEGDFLYNLMDHRPDEIDSFCIRNVLRADYNPAVRVDVSMDELFDRSLRQNFIPVTDDLGHYIGIVTRKDIILAFLNESQHQ